MESNRQRKFVSQRLFGKLTKIAKTVGEAVDISDDRLGGRYQVNKFGITVESRSLGALTRLQSRLMAELTTEGWNIDSTSGSSTIVQLPTLSTAKAFIDPARMSANPAMARFDIVIL
jgi:hypothetical protein